MIYEYFFLLLLLHLQQPFVVCVFTFYVKKETTRITNAPKVENLPVNLEA